MKPLQTLGREIEQLYLEDFMSLHEKDTDSEAFIDALANFFHEWFSQIKTF